MKRNWWLRFSLLVVLTILSVAAIIPTIFRYDEAGNYPIKSKINLGLDLQGGLYMILGIDFKKVYTEEITAYGKKLEDLLGENGIVAKPGQFDGSDAMDPKQAIVLENLEQREAAKEKIKEYYPGVLRLTKEENAVLEYALSKTTKTTIQEQAVGKSIEVIRNRIDEFGVTEPEITSQGMDRVVVQLPGVKDIERAKELIGKTAKLEFKIVNDSIPMNEMQAWLDKADKAQIVYKKGERFSDYLSKLNEYLKADLPEGYELAFQKQMSKTSSDVVDRVPYLVEAKTKLAGDLLEDARVTIDQQENLPVVSLAFKPAGAKGFEDITGDNVGKRLAIVLDGNVYSAPVINGRIGGGRAQINMGRGNYNTVLNEARDLALVLRAGALPVQLDFLEQRTVGPSLGQDSISKVTFAAMIGCAIVFLFVLIYYRLAGVIAVITLLLNVLFVLAVLVAFEATLTLPGIAGIALTVGMAVDGNIIIYERIREELRRGMSNYKAVEAGFDQAFWTIVDANVTTALAGFCLLNFGTGPVRGFAVTLLIGIAATVYTAYFVSKLCFEFYMNKVEGQELSI